MRILDPGPVEHVQQAGEDRAPDVLVRPRHCAGFDLALEARSHHQIVAIADAIEERRQRREVVGAIGVGHHDDVAFRGRESGHVGRAVAAPTFVNDSRAGMRGRIRRPVGRPVIDHDDLAGHPRFVHCGLRFANDRGDAVDLVQAGKHDRDAFAHRGEASTRYAPETLS